MEALHRLSRIACSLIAHGVKVVWSHRAAAIVGMGIGRETDKEESS